MLLSGKRIVFALAEEVYTYKRIIPQMEDLIKQGAEIIPIMSYNAYNIINKCSETENFINIIEKITFNKIIFTIDETEKLLNEEADIMIIAPCSRKYNRENGEWNYRYNYFKCCKITFKKRKKFSDRNSN